MSETKDNRGRAVRKVKPFLDELEAKPFWANLREHKLTAQRCKACGKLFTFPPQGSCPHCLSPEYEWVPAQRQRQSLFVRHLQPRLAPVLRRQGALQRFVGRSRRGTALDQQRHRLPAGASQDRHAGGSGLRGQRRLHLAEVSSDEVSCARACRSLFLTSNSINRQTVEPRWVVIENLIDHMRIDFTFGFKPIQSQ